MSVEVSQGGAATATLSGSAILMRHRRMLRLALGTTFSFVTAEMLEAAFRRHAAIAFEHYLAQVHALGAELPLSGLLTRMTPELGALAEQSPDRSPRCVRSSRDFAGRSSRRLSTTGARSRPRARIRSRTGGRKR